MMNDGVDAQSILSPTMTSNTGTLNDDDKTQNMVGFQAQPLNNISLVSLLYYLWQQLLVAVNATDWPLTLPRATTPVNA